MAYFCSEFAYFCLANYSNLKKMAYFSIFRRTFMYFGHIIYNLRIYIRMAYLLRTCIKYNNQKFVFTSTIGIKFSWNYSNDLAVFGFEHWDFLRDGSNDFAENRMNRTILGGESVGVLECWSVGEGWGEGGLVY